MKTRKQKVICRVLCLVVSISLIASFFVVPVSAEQNYYISKIEQNVSSYDTSYFRVFDCINDSDYSTMNTKTYSDGVSSKSVDKQADENIEYTFDFYNSTNHSFCLLYLGTTSLHSPTDDGSLPDYYFQVGDTAWLSNGKLFMDCVGDMFSITSYRFVLREYIASGVGDKKVYYGEVVAATDVQSCYISNTTNDLYVEYDSLVFEFLRSITTSNLTLCLEFYASSYYNTNRVVAYLQNEFYLNYGVGKDPNYPIYTPAPGGDDIGSLDSQEQQLIQDSQVGLDAGVDVMQNTGDLITDLDASLNLIAFTGAFNQIMNHLVLIPGLNPLVSISLSLGLFASLFGLAGSIISAASRGSGQAQREAQRESRKK